MTDSFAIDHGCYRPDSTCRIDITGMKMDVDNCYCEKVEGGFKCCDVFLPTEGKSIVYQTGQRYSSFIFWSGETLVKTEYLYLPADVRINGDDSRRLRAGLLGEVIRIRDEAGLDSYDRRPLSSAVAGSRFYDEMQHTLPLRSTGSDLWDQDVRDRRVERLIEEGRLDEAQSLLEPVIDKLYGDSMTNLVELARKKEDIGLLRRTAGRIRSLPQDLYGWHWPSIVTGMALSGHRNDAENVIRNDVGGHRRGEALLETVKALLERGMFDDAGFMTRMIPTGARPVAAEAYIRLGRAVGDDRFIQKGIRFVKYISSRYWRAVTALDLWEISGLRALKAIYRRDAEQIKDDDLQQAEMYARIAAVEGNADYYERALRIVTPADRYDKLSRRLCLESMARAFIEHKRFGWAGRMVAMVDDVYERRTLLYELGKEAGDKAALIESDRLASQLLATMGQIDVLLHGKLQVVEELMRLGEDEEALKVVDSFDRITWYRETNRAYWKGDAEVIVVREYAKANMIPEAIRIAERIERDDKKAVAYAELAANAEPDRAPVVIERE